MAYDLYALTLQNDLIVGDNITTNGTVDGVDIQTLNDIVSNINTHLGSVDQGIDTTDSVSYAQLNVDNIQIEGNTISATTGEVLIANVPPVAPNAFATKKYTDSLATGLNVKDSARLKTQAALPAYTYDNGAAGVGATITGNSNGPLSVDSIAVALNDRILVESSGTTSDIHNGIYKVTNIGTGVPWVLTRSSDADNSPGQEVAVGMFAYIFEGTSIGRGCILNIAPSTIGTDPWVFAPLVTADNTNVINLTGGSGIFHQDNGGQFQFKSLKSPNDLITLSTILQPSNITDVVTTFNQGNITGTGILTDGDIASGFGDIDNSDNEIKTGYVKFTPTTEPLTPAVGTMYFDSTTSTIRVWNGTSWE